MAKIKKRKYSKKQKFKYRIKGFIHSVISSGSYFLLDLIFDGRSKKTKKSKPNGANNLTIIRKSNGFDAVAFSFKYDRVIKRGAK